MPEYAISLAGELYAGKPLDAFEGNKWTERGHELEDAARAKYEMMRDIDAVQIGFVTDYDLRYGCSPDSLIADDGMLEIKCLKAENHIKALMYYRKHNKSPTTYVPQVQEQMLASERSWCELVFYHPKMPHAYYKKYPKPKDIGYHDNQAR